MRDEIGLDDDDGNGGGNSLTSGEFVPVYTSYIWSAAPGAYIDSMIARVNTAYGTLYVQHDANFNVTALTNTSGAVVERFIYDAYGTATYLDPNWSVDTGGTDYAWVYLNQGLRHEGVSNTDDARNRVVLPALGRPAQPDPIRYADGMNYYQWEASNPARWLDPWGLDVWKEGPSSSGGHTEPAGHMSIGVGDPNGSYKAYSFGVDPDDRFSWDHGLTGRAYEDTTPGGAIDDDS